MKICPVCHCEFKSKHKTAIYCSYTCRGIADRTRNHLARICPQCGNTFQDSRHPERVYCSRNCYLKSYHTPPMTKRCPQCKQTKSVEKFSQSKTTQNKISKLCISCQRFNLSQTKRCPKCGNSFPATVEFFYYIKTRGKLSCYCRLCTQAVVHEDYDKHKVDRRRQKQNYILLNKFHRTEYNRTYYRNNKQVFFNAVLRRNAKKQALPATFTIYDWERCLAYWGNRCAYCGKSVEPGYILSQDHFVPVNDGGGYTPGNIVPACHAQKNSSGGCNRQKSYRNAKEWLIEKYGEDRASEILENINDYFEWTVSHTTASTRSSNVVDANS